MDEHIKSFYEKGGQWWLIFAVAVVAVLLWMSWFNGWFPFSGSSPFFGGKEKELTTEEILKSLTPLKSATSSPEDVAATLKTLESLTPTPAPTSKTKPKATSPAPIDPETAAILESLTPKK